MEVDDDLSNVVAEYLNGGLIVHCKASPMGKSLLATYYRSGKALNLG
jgi:hypothetical protein